jgi:MATE family multidrug resistance protein
MSTDTTLAGSAVGRATLAPMTWGQELRATFTLAWPLVIAQLAQNALFTTDVIMMGWLGPRYLAAGALASAFLMPILLLGIGIVGAVAPLVAQARGARQIRPFAGSCARASGQPSCFQRC